LKKRTPKELHKQWQDNQENLRRDDHRCIRRVITCHDLVKLLKCLLDILHLVHSNILDLSSIFRKVFHLFLQTNELIFMCSTKECSCSSSEEFLGDKSRLQAVFCWEKAKNVLLHEWFIEFVSENGKPFFENDYEITWEKAVLNPRGFTIFIGGLRFIYILLFLGSFFGLR